MSSMETEKFFFLIFERVDLVPMKSGWERGGGFGRQGELGLTHVAAESNVIFTENIVRWMMMNGEVQAQNLGVYQKRGGTVGMQIICVGPAEYGQRDMI